MSTQHDGNDADQDDSEHVNLDLDVRTIGDSRSAPESLFQKLSRCGNPRDSTPLPWEQLSVVMLVSLSEGACLCCLLASLPLLNTVSTQFAL